VRWIIVAMLGMQAFPAWAQSVECRANPHLSRAKDEYDRLEFDRAGRTLQRAIEYSRNCRWGLAEIYRLKAFVDAVNAERERCQRAFEVLLALDPDYVMPRDVPPKIRSCFDEALDVDSSRRRLALAVEPPTTAVPDAPVPVDVRVDDPLRLVDEVQVHFRRKGLSVYTTVTTRANDDVSVVIPALAVPSAPEAYEMEYFVRAVNRWEGVLSEVGSSRQPMGFAVAKGKTSRAFYEKWWFWTIAGVAVAGGVTTAVLATGGSDEVTLRFGSAGR
jgi:hypothetical protein